MCPFGTEITTIINQIIFAWRTGKPEIQVTPDYQRCTDYGVTLAEIALMFRTFFAGDVESTFQVQGEKHDISVKLADADRTDLESASSLPIQTPKGIVRLEALVDVKMAENPNKIYRYKRQRAITMKTLNLVSIMEVIMLVGIVVNNGLILIDRIEFLRREKGMAWREVIVPASKVWCKSSRWPYFERWSVVCFHKVSECYWLLKHFRQCGFKFLSENYDKSDSISSSVKPNWRKILKT